MEDVTNPTIADFWINLYEAHGEAEMVDGFDLRSDDPDSVAEYDALVRDRNAAAITLVRHILAHANSLMIALTT